jgi:hypothetical protein
MGRHSVISSEKHALTAAAIVLRGYLGEDRRGDGAAIKKAIEAVLSDIELDVQSESEERS